MVEEQVSTFYEVLRLPWPGGGEWVQELTYRVDAAGQVVPNDILTTEERAALQALVDHRGPEARKPGRGNSLEEISYDSPEAQLTRALSLALLPPEELQAYHKAEKHEAARDLVRETHKGFDHDFHVCEIEPLEDGTGLVQVMDDGPNWTTCYTLYILGPGPEIEIVESSCPWGEHTFNHHFHTGPIYERDESGLYDDFRSHLAYLWRDCPGWLT